MESADRQPHNLALWQLGIVAAKDRKHLRRPLSADDGKAGAIRKANSAGTPASIRTNYTGHRRNRRIAESTAWLPASAEESA